jgi:16S rRNA (guanine966-N2)-methyltransferase
MAQKKHRRSSPSARPPDRRASGRKGSQPERPAGLRIIGGKFRGRKLEYAGDSRVRPMKDRVREAVFNLLGPAVLEKHALDLFAGTGALGLEALSRGASRATLIEQHYPTAAVIGRNIAALGVGQEAELVVANVFLWARRQLPPSLSPWLVFSSPPYDFYISRAAEMLELLNRLMDAAAADSLLVVEADERFQFEQLPDPAGWDIRVYPPAVIGIYHKVAGTLRVP